MLPVGVAAAVFVLLIALLYGSTMIPSPRGGLQPADFNDEAFYSVLGADLAHTGTESIFSPSGFMDIAGLPSQSWYHWGELWLASGVIAIFGTPPLLARHFVVLPLVLLAAAALTGTVARRFTRTNSRQVYVGGFLACLFLAPVPVVQIPYFSGSNVGLVFGITTYGMAAVGVLLALCCVLAVRGSSTRGSGLSWFLASTAAFLLPSHIAVALLAIAGVGSVWAVHIIRSLATTRRMPWVQREWRRIIAVTTIVAIATIAWGLMTGHGQAAGGVPIVGPFGSAWRDSIAATALGGGVFFVIVAAWLIVRRRDGIETDLYVGTMALVVAGAVAWGARLGEFTMFHVFFSAIAVFATPTAVIAIWRVWHHLRASGRRSLATALIVVFIAQLEVGVVSGTFRMQAYGPDRQLGIPLGVFDAIRQLPPDAKMAYSCWPFEESAFNTPRLLTLDAHSGRRIIPMCYSAEILSGMIGAQLSIDQPNLYFNAAPQRSLYPNAAANPKREVIASWLLNHDIRYIYVDQLHPNRLVTDAVPIVSIHGVEVLRIP
jgi:hypothetical protein